MKMFYRKLSIILGIICLFSVATTTSIATKAVKDNELAAANSDLVKSTLDQEQIANGNSNTSGKQQASNSLGDKFRNIESESSSPQMMDDINTNNFRSMFPYLTRLLSFWFHPSNLLKTSATRSEPIMENSNIMQVFANEHSHVDKSEDESLKRLVRQNPNLLNDLIGQFQRLNREITGQLTPNILQQTPFVQPLPLLTQGVGDGVGKMLEMTPGKLVETQNVNNDGGLPAISSIILRPDGNQIQLLPPLFDGLNHMTQSIASQIRNPLGFIPLNIWPNNPNNPNIPTTPTTPNPPALQGANSIMSEIRIKPNDGRFSYKTIPNEMYSYPKKIENLLEMQQQTVLKNDVLKKTLPILWFPLPMQQSTSNSKEDFEILNDLLMLERGLIMELQQLQDIASVANKMKKSQGNHLESATDIVTLNRIPIHKITMEDIEKALNDKHVMRVLQQHYRNQSSISESVYRSPSKRQTNPDSFRKINNTDLLKMMMRAYLIAIANARNNYPTATVANGTPLSSYGLLIQQQDPQTGIRQNYLTDQQLLNPQYLRTQPFNIYHQSPIQQQPQQQPHQHFFRILNDTVPGNVENLNINLNTVPQTHQPTSWQNPSNSGLLRQHEENPRLLQNEHKSQLEQQEQDVHSGSLKKAKNGQLEASIAELINSNIASQNSPINKGEQLHATTEYTKLEHIQQPHQHQHIHQHQFQVKPLMEQTTTQATTTSSSVESTSQKPENTGKVAFRDLFGEVFDNTPEYRKLPPVINPYSNHNRNMNNGLYRMAVGDDEILQMLRQHNALPPWYQQSLHE